MTPSVRKPHRYGGLQVRICGRRLNKGETICTLPPNKHSIHATIAMGEDGSLVAIIRKEDETVELWQLVGPPE